MRRSSIFSCDCCSSSVAAARCEAPALVLVLKGASGPHPTCALVLGRCARGRAPSETLDPGAAHRPPSARRTAEPPRSGRACPSARGAVEWPVQGVPEAQAPLTPRARRRALRRDGRDDRALTPRAAHDRGGVRPVGWEDDQRTPTRHERGSASRGIRRWMVMPAGADAFADHFGPWFHPEIRLVGPQPSTLTGLGAFRARFARPLFALLRTRTASSRAGRGAVTSSTSSFDTRRDGRPAPRHVSHGRPGGAPRRPSRRARGPRRRDPAAPGAGRNAVGRPAARPSRVAAAPAAGRDDRRQRGCARRTRRERARRRGPQRGVLPARAGSRRGRHPVAADRLRVEQPLSFWMPVRVAGAALVLAGVLAPVPTFARLAHEGRGTPAPPAPTERLVVEGLYRHGATRCTSRWRRRSSGRRCCSGR